VDTTVYLLEALSHTSTAVEKKLERLLSASPVGEHRLVDAMRYSMFAGGKRLRPFLVVCSADLFGVDKASSLRVAAAVECIHCYSLIHDDLPAMDDDKMRRGKPTAHIQYDEATAILAGDALQSLAFEILSAEETHADPNVRCKLVSKLAKASGMHGMAGGQMMDIEAPEKQVSMGEVTHLQHMKTGALIGYCVEAGSILGKASKQKQNLLQSYARDLGLAFQITDDLLDLRGNEARVGKALSKDANKGKATFVSLLGEDRAQSQAEMLIEQAISRLDEFGDSAVLLRALAIYVLERDK
jgi:farnesyl diphosphate synthase